MRGARQAACIGGAGKDNYRVVSADTMKFLSPNRRGAGKDELVLVMRPSQIDISRGAAAR